MTAYLSSPADITDDVIEYTARKLQEFADSRRNDGASVVRGCSCLDNVIVIKLNRLIGLLESATLSEQSEPEWVG